MIKQTAKYVTETTCAERLSFIISSAKSYI